MMYGYLENFTENYCCGIIGIKYFSFTNKHKYTYGEPLPAITEENILKFQGARLLQAGFVKGEEKSEVMFSHLINTFGEPTFKSKVRKNTNSNNMFFTAFWELEERT